LHQTLEHINAAIQWFAAFPVVCNQQPAVVHGDNGIGNEDNGDDAKDNAANHAHAANIPYESTLSPKLHNLYEMWQEFEHGIGGCRPARDFSPCKRGQVKTIYMQCKVEWDETLHLVHAGNTHLVAIDHIYQASGPSLSVTKIIKKFR